MTDDRPKPPRPNLKPELLKIVPPLPQQPPPAPSSRARAPVENMIEEPQGVVVTIKSEEPQPEPEAKPSFWSDKAWPFIRKYILAPLPLLIILAGAIILIALGAKNIQIGGLIGKLLGRSGDDGKKAINVANSIPADRVDAKGNLIPIGQPDSKGITQAKIVPIKKPGLFDDPTKVTVTDDDGKDIKVTLPDGVKASEVEKVVLVTPEITAVTVKSTSKVPASHVDDLLKKYKL